MPMALDTSAKKKDSIEDDSKFPTGQMVTLAICRFSEPIAFDSVNAYAYVMVQWLFENDSSYSNNQHASFYAGLLISAYAFGEVLTAVIWGNVSDRIGRKPIVLSGLCGVALSCIMFGFAQTYWVALLARLIGGMLNGNVAVMQTMLAEMVKRPEHEPTAYAIHPFVWYAGGILGSAMGGYLAQPAHYYPSLFPPDGVFGRYPYLLPNLVCVVAIVIAVIQGAFFLKETNPLLLEKRRMRPIAMNQDRDETTPLLSPDLKDVDSTVTELDSSQASSPERANSLEDGLPSTTDPYFDFRRSSFGTMPSINAQPSAVDPSTQISKPDLKTTFNFTVVMLIISLILMSYHSMGYFNLLPVYLLDKPRTSNKHLDLKGGLGYDVHAVGSFMAGNGFIALFVQAVIFPIFVSKVGVWKSFVSMTILYPLTYPLIPLLTLLPFGGLRSAGVYGIMVIQNHLNIIIPPCALILLKNAVPSPLVLGTVNGACMSMLSAARTAAPPVQGIIYSAGGSGANWYSLMGVTVLAAVQLFWIPREPPKQVGVGSLASSVKDVHERNELDRRRDEVAVEC